MKAKNLKNNKIMEISNQIFAHYTIWLHEKKIKNAIQLLEKNGYKVIKFKNK
jgi:hypothetical protein